MPSKMKRTQIYLEADVDDGLRRLALRRGVSKAQLLRESARRLVDMERSTRDPLMDLIGLAQCGPDDISEKHDSYLSEAEVSGWRK